MNKQKGSAHVIIIAAFVILLAGVLGVLFWQNLTGKQGTHDKNASSETTTKETEKKTVEKGIITGSLTYPSEGIPSSVTVYATNIDTKEEFSTGEHLSGSQYKYGVGYSLSVPAGDYYVYGVKGVGSDQRAYYDNFVECNFANYDSCANAEQKIRVTVEPNKETKDIMVGDWYKPCVIEGGKQPTEKFKLPTC